jgi:hypothetical protein
MRLSSNIFLIAYAIFLVFGLGFVIISSDSGSINNLICAVSIASSAISLSDLFYSKLNIDKSERIQLTTCYLVAQHKSNYYMKQIEKKYGGAAEEMISRLMQVFNEDEIERLFSNDFTDDEKNAYLEKIKITIDDENRASQISMDINELTSFEKDEDFTDEQSVLEDGANVIKLLQAGKSKEKNNLLIANMIAILGLTLFLVVLAWDNIFQKHISTLNNVLTISAFLTVVLNFLIKDNYRAKSLQEIESTKKELYKL